MPCQAARQVHHGPVHILLAFGAYADDRATPDEAVSMVHRVIADMKASSKDAVIAEINT